MIETQEALDNLDGHIVVRAGRDLCRARPTVDLARLQPWGDKPDEWLMRLKKDPRRLQRHKSSLAPCGSRLCQKRSRWAHLRHGRRRHRLVTMGAAEAVAEMRDAPKPGDSSSPY